MSEREALLERQARLGRSSATAAALIPIRKSPAWWDLAQDERRAIFEERSHQIARSLPYLPRIARRLLGALRETEEWRYVEREVDIRLQRAAS